MYPVIAEGPGGDSPEGSALLSVPSGTLTVDVDALEESRAAFADVGFGEAPTIAWPPDNATSATHVTITMDFVNPARDRIKLREASPSDCRRLMPE
jgi:hypothetical protein